MNQPKENHPNRERPLPTTSPPEDTVPIPAPGEKGRKEVIERLVEEHDNRSSAEESEEI